MDDTARQRGRALLDLGRPRDAERHLRAALAADPQDPSVLALLAEAQLRQRLYEEARHTSRSALAADPAHVHAHSTLTEALTGLKRYGEAHHAVRRGLALAPEIAGLHLQEADVLVAQQKLGDALVCVERARVLAPESPLAAALHAGILCDLRRYDEAEAAVAEALCLDPEHAGAHRVRGVIALHRGGGEDAVRAHRDALRLDPVHEMGRTGLAHALKTRNPLYRWRLRFSLWLDRQPRGRRLAAVLLTPVVLTLVLQPFADRWWARVPIVAIVAVALLSWLLEPLMNLVLMLGRDRHVVPPVARQATYLFLFFFAAAVACALTGWLAGPPQLLLIALGFGLWALASGTSHLIRPRQRAVVRIGALTGIALGAVAIPAALAGAHVASYTAALVLLSGVVGLWVTAFSK